jgi:hypothetical protein
MGTVAAPMLAFNRGVISRTTLARTDIERTRLSAEVMTNFLPKTQGPMLLRPGTKYIGSSLNDTGAAWIEFVASTTQTALLELTNEKMRVWLPSDTGNTWETPVATGLDVLLARPSVATALSITDTGWADVSSGGSVSTQTASAIPEMEAETTNRVKMTASSSNVVALYGGLPWNAGDRALSLEWHDTGSDTVSSLPSWLNVDFDTGAVTGNYIAVKKYSIRASFRSAALDNAPRSWRLITGNFDTGTYATDTGKWTLEDERSGQIDWSVSEKKTFTPPGADTGTIEARRHWRLYVTETDTGNVAGDATKSLVIAEVEMFTDADVSQQFILNATARGSVAKFQKRVIVATADRNKEHSLNIYVSRGPLNLRVGSAAGDDDYIRETDIGTGYHNLAFTPGSTFYVTVQNDKQVDRVIQKLQIGDSGSVEITTPWGSADIDNIRFDQSADVIYVDCDGVRPHKIERRGTGRSWSVVEYSPNNGPFLAARTSTAKLGMGAKYGNTQCYASQAFFRPTHVGTLFQITHEGQSGKWLLGNTDAATDPITVTGISDTGTPGTTNERRISFTVSGTHGGQVTVERSFDGPEFGFKRVTSDYVTSGSAQDTGSFSCTVDDKDDNVTVWYRARVSSATSGVATVESVHKNGSVTGTARITSYVSPTQVDVEILENFSDTGSSSNWIEGAWSGLRGYPTAVGLHEGRLAHGGGASIWASVSDDYENFSALVEGEAGPISRTLGSGPVDSINFLVSLLRLVAGTAGSEITIKASSFDETLTPVNAAAGAFSTQGSAQLRAVKLDSRALFVQRSRERLYMVGPGVSASAVNDYESSEMTILAPEILKPGVVSIAIQRQPDTRIHCVLSDGTVAILTYEPQEEVLAWSKWVTDTGSNSAVERAMVLPGIEEDQVYYHVRRTIKGATKRFLERWALESECRGDTGLSWLADCAVSHRDTGGTLTVADFAPHLGGQTIAVWANDTGQSNSVGKDMTPDDTGGTQQLLSLDTGGDLTLTDSGWKHLVGGLSYRADFKSTKLAYGAQGATAMTMKKRVARLALVLNQTHNNALFVGSDTGHLDPLPRIDDEGAQVDANKIYTEYDKLAFPVDGDWDEDSRLYIRAKSPRPATIMAALPRITTNES